MPKLSPKAQAGRDFLDDLLGKSSSKAKKCKTGKSCGSSCVNNQKTCRVKFSPKVSESIGKVAKTVKTVNYNWTEAAVAAILTGRTIENKEDLKRAIEAMGFENSDLYISNLMKGSSGSNPSSDKEFREYISGIKKHLAPLTGITDRVSVPGSTRNSPSVREIDQNLNKKQIKADVIAWVKGKPVGVSEKDGPGAPLTNYTIEGGKNSNLRKIRMDLLKDAGFESNWRKKVSSEEEKKTTRKKMNQLLYDKDSKYWDEMKKEIKTNEKTILKDLIEGMTARGVPYPMYETDGTRLKNLDQVYQKLTNPSNKVELKVIDNPAKNPGPSAALHLGLFVNGEKEYDGKVRFKGNLFSPPEFLLKNKGYS